MKKDFFVLTILLLLTAMLGTIGCESDEESEPIISFTDLCDNSITDRVAVIEVNAASDAGVASVTFFVEGENLGEMVRDGSSWNYYYDWENSAIGESIEIYAKVRDNDGNSATTPTITIYNQFVLLESDGIESYPRNLLKVYSRANSAFLGFRVEYSEEWIDPYDAEQGINCSIFLDTDRDVVTGLSEESEYHYYPNDIGADYMILCGNEGVGLYSWGSVEDGWVYLPVLPIYSLSENSSSFEIAVSLSDISNPQHLDLVAGSLTAADETVYLDWLPDDTSISLPIVNCYMGDDYNIAPTMVQSQPITTAPYFWLSKGGQNEYK